MIEIGSGDLLSADVEALVNTVNTVGVMGKGLALQFKRRFPANFDAYAVACARGEVKVGRMHVVEAAPSRAEVLDLFLPCPEKKLRCIVNFPTKKCWRDPSQIEYVQLGLAALVEEIRAREIRSIAVPPLGCGNGGLSWLTVEPLIRKVMSVLSDTRVVLFAPNARAQEGAGSRQ